MTFGAYSAMCARWMRLHRAVGEAGLQAAPTATAIAISTRRTITNMLSNSLAASSRA